jgi:chromosome segregation ATPase
MRPTMWMAATVLLFATPAACVAQQATQTQSQTQSQSQVQGQAQAQNQSAAPAKTQATVTNSTNSVAEAARKAKQDQKNAPKPVVFTNENLPRASTISIVGTNRPPETGAELQADAAADAKSDEQAWRQKFADARYKLQQDRQKLQMLQNEFNALGMVRYFNEADAVSKQQAIADQQKQINADQAAIDDLTEELRKAGGDPAWAR